jgi:hypothetical protein
MGWVREPLEVFDHRDVRMCLDQSRHQSGSRPVDDNRIVGHTVILATDRLDPPRPDEDGATVL